MVTQDNLDHAKSHLFYVQGALKFITSEDRAFYKMEALLEVFGALMDAQECLVEYEKDALAEVKVIDVRCPYCGRPAGSQCLPPTAMGEWKFHTSRYELAEKGKQP